MLVCYTGNLDLKKKKGGGEWRGEGCEYQQQKLEK